MEYFVSIIRPGGYAHSDGFLEIAEVLQSGLRGMGYRASAGENTLMPGATNIILGAHLLGEANLAVLPAGSVIYNLEQLGGEMVSDAYYGLAARFQIWDYSPLNLARWLEHPCLHAPQRLEIGYAPELTRIAPAPEQDIDVLFYGSISEHRREILLALERTGIRLHVVFGVYGAARDDLIARAKIVLNIHNQPARLFEIVRVSYLLANAKAVVSEISPDIGEYAEVVAAFEPDRIVEGCLALLRDEPRRRAMEAGGLDFFSRRHISRSLGQVVPKPGPRRGEAPEHDLRKLYLDMLQKSLPGGEDRYMAGLRQICEFVVQNGVDGDFVETGAWRGGSAIMMRAVLKAHGIADRQVRVCDAFARSAGAGVSLTQAQSLFATFGLLDDQVVFPKVFLPQSLPAPPAGEVAVLRLGGGPHHAASDALAALYDSVAAGGFVIVDDYGATIGCKQAVDAFRESRGIVAPLQSIDGSGVFWCKTTPARQPAAA